MSLKIYRDIKNDWAFLIGSIHDNKLHKHYAIQLSIAVEGNLALKGDESIHTIQHALLIKPNQKHLIESTGDNLHLFFNPHSKMGLFLNALAEEPFFIIKDHLIEKLISFAEMFLMGEISIQQLSDFIENAFMNYQPFVSFEQNIDERLVKVFELLDQNKHRWLKAEECAEMIHLSRSRFLHFFKEKTGGTFRRAQLWVRITDSLNMLGKKGLSETAFHYGFVDNAHYCKAFKENLGFTPQQLLKLARLYNTSASGLNRFEV